VVYVNEMECWPNTTTEIDVSGNIEVRSSQACGSFDLRGLPVPIAEE
jgi:hypothetical protein